MALHLTRYSPPSSDPRPDDDRAGGDRAGEGRAPGLSDEALVQLARGGEPAPFDVLGRRHLPRLYALLFRLVGNHEDAEDLTQDAFCRAWEGLALFRGGDFAAWISRIAIHLARDQHRRRGRRPASRSFDEARPAVARGSRDRFRERSQDEGSAGRSSRAARAGSDELNQGATTRGPADLAAQREFALALRRAVDGLPFALKSAFCLRVFDERGYDEIAVLCGVTPQTARTQVMKARRRLEMLLRGLEDER